MQLSAAPEFITDAAALAAEVAARRADGAVYVEWDGAAETAARIAALAPAPYTVTVVEMGEQTGLAARGVDASGGFSGFTLLPGAFFVLLTGAAHWIDAVTELHVMEPGEVAAALREEREADEYRLYLESLPWAGEPEASEEEAGPYDAIEDWAERVFHGAR